MWLLTTTPAGGGDTLSPASDTALAGHADVTLATAAVGDAVVITAPHESGHAPPCVPAREGSTVVSPLVSAKVSDITNAPSSDANSIVNSVLDDVAVCS